MRAIEIMIKEIDFRKTLLDSVNFYTISNLLKRYIK